MESGRDMIKMETMNALINSINQIKATPTTGVKKEFIYEERECSVVLQFTSTPTYILEVEVRYLFTRLVFQSHHSHEPISEEVREQLRYRVLQSLVVYALLGEGGNMVTTTKERNEQRRTKR
jgi:hypothetical protein